jgi:hypothetical protein
MLATLCIIVISLCEWRAVAVLAHMQRRTASLKTNFVRQRLHRIDSTAIREQPGISVLLLMEKASLLPNVTLN